MSAKKLSKKYPWVTDPKTPALTVQSFGIQNAYISQVGNAPIGRHLSRKLVHCAPRGKTWQRVEKL